MRKDVKGYAQAFSYPLFDSVSSLTYRMAWGYGLLLPFSQLLTIEKVAPTLAADYSYVRHIL